MGVSGEADTEQEVRHVDLLALLCGVLGILLLLVGFVQQAGGRAQSSRVKPTSGTVLDWQERGGGYRLRVRYRRPDGTNRKAWSRDRVERPGRRGENVPVWYEPERERVVVSSPRERVYNGTGVMICGLLLLGCAVLAAAGTFP
jgi:hypothetical protein